VGWELDDGTIEQVSMLEALNRLVGDTMLRTKTLHVGFFPELVKYHLSPWDLRYKRNANRMHATLLKVLQDRRAGKSKHLTDFDDLLDIMINDDLFKNDDQSIIDEMLGFFMAGSMTTQVATTNLIYYMI